VTVSRKEVAVRIIWRQQIFMRELETRYEIMSNE
jgi:hypothetical protein